jgi:hypothetical protein
MKAQSVLIRWNDGPPVKGYSVYRCLFAGICFAVRTMSKADAEMARENGVELVEVVL